MLGVNDIIADVEAKRLCSHCYTFQIAAERAEHRSAAPQSDRWSWLPSLFRGFP